MTIKFWGPETSAGGEPGGEVVELPPTSTQAEAEAGLVSEPRTWTPQRGRQSADAAITARAGEFATDEQGALADAALPADTLTADGLALVTATVTEQRVLLGVPGDMIFGDLLDDGPDLIMGAIDA